MLVSGVLAYVRACARVYGWVGVRARACMRACVRVCVRMRVRVRVRVRLCGYVYL